MAPQRSGSRCAPTAGFPAAAPRAAARCQSGRCPPRSSPNWSAVPETYTDEPILTEAFDRAPLLASDHHRRQLRKGTNVPYVAHLIAVASLTLEMGGSETEAIGALLHDAIEDGGGPPMRD